jgi:hypothetical protein
MVKEKKAGMRSPTMPKEHWERDQKQSMESNTRYATEFGNPEELDRDQADLAKYVRKNKVKR